MFRNGGKMKVKIIGSGGCVSIPRPCCQCRICKEARKRGVPYARTGCSLYVEDGHILIDTPEDINASLNNAEADDVECVLYSHIDPDHTMGMRVFEQLRMNWLNVSVGIENENPVQVTALPRILEDLKKQGTKYGSTLEYYEQMGLVKLVPGNAVERKGVRVDLIPTDSGDVTVFVIRRASDGEESEQTEPQEKKLLYAPCDVKPFLNHELFYGADTLIIGNTMVGEVLKDGFVLKKDNPLREELFVLEEIATLKEKFKIRQVIITHLEEDWGKSYDDYKALEKELDGIRFAYDGMEITL